MWRGHLKLFFLSSFQDLCTVWKKLPYWVKSHSGDDLGIIYNTYYIIIPIGICMTLCTSIYFAYLYIRYIYGIIYMKCNLCYERTNWEEIYIVSLPSVQNGDQPVLSHLFSCIILILGHYWTALSFFCVPGAWHFLFSSCSSPIQLSHFDNFLPWLSWSALHFFFKTSGLKLAFVLKAFKIIIIINIFSHTMIDDFPQARKTVKLGSVWYV